MVRATPDLDAIYVVNPGDYSICEEIAKVDMQKRIRIITNDIVSRQMYLIDSVCLVRQSGSNLKTEECCP